MIEEFDFPFEPWAPPKQFGYDRVRHFAPWLSWVDETTVRQPEESRGWHQHPYAAGWFLTLDSVVDPSSFAFNARTFEFQRPDPPWRHWRAYDEPVWWLSGRAERVGVGGRVDARGAIIELLGDADLREVAILEAMVARALELSAWSLGQLPKEQQEWLRGCRAQKLLPYACPKPGSRP